MPVIATLIFSADATGMPPPVDGPGGPGGPAGPSVPGVPAAPSLPLQPAKRRPISERTTMRAVNTLELGMVRPLSYYWPYTQYTAMIVQKFL
jgi:hypothetical protein